MRKYTVRDLPLAGKRVLLRVDFNVPVDEAGRITSDNRIRAALPTIEYIRQQGGMVILASHFGRPKGEPNPKYSLKPVAERLAALTGQEVKFAPDCIGPEVLKIVRAAQPGEIVMLENLRFHREEEKNDPEFAARLAELADCYVNDAFGAAHRAHASTEGVAKHFAQPAAGLLMEKEIRYLSQVLESPARPLVAIIGGAKVSDKLSVIRNLLPKVDQLLLGGGLIFNFLKARGLEIGKSIHEDDLLAETEALLNAANLKLPVDVVITDNPDVPTQVRNVAVNEIPHDWSGMDIGSESAADYSRVIAAARTIVWAGPMGRFELEPFAGGTRTVAQAVADATAQGAVSVVGGGDTGAALKKFGLADRVSHISTGGGACLEFLEGRTLPGIAALKDK